VSFVARYPSGSLEKDEEGKMRRGRRITEREKATCVAIRD